MEHSIGSRIKSLRKARGLTAAQLAGQVGITENAIRKIEAGSSREPRFTVGLRIAETLGTAATVLAGSEPLQKHFTRLELEASSLKSAPDLASVIRDIRRLREDLAREGVEHVAVFGSVARGEASPSSDVDVIVYPCPAFTLFNLISAKDILEHALGKPVDALTHQTLKGTPFSAAAQAEAVNVF